MEPDFSGWATKAGLKCSDGRTIMAGAFKHQDKMKVPLVWQHGHKDPTNVLGHAILENREDGVYAYAFFNNSPKAVHTKESVDHKDITMMSIWANELVERAGKVLHGAIREVSLVLSGANPGALIENITIRHSDGDEDILDDEVIIYTGLELEHSSMITEEDDKEEYKEDEDEDDKEDKEEDKEDEELEHANQDDETIQDIYDSMNTKQKDVLHFMLGQALETANDSIQQDNVKNSDDPEKGDEMKHNVFENKDEKSDGYSLSHSDINEIVTNATRNGSLKEAVEEFALAHGITDIDVLFPDAQTLDSIPEFLQRRTEWVGKFLANARKSPFSRIKTISADLTQEEARAKGYITGSLKKEEFFGVLKRVTVPTTIYKKQKLDRDDMVDITDFDVVTWLKAEMRLMLDEELARAALIGDGRDVSHEDKINEGNIRPISKDHELYVTTLYVNLLNASSSIQEFIDAVIKNRKHFKGSGMPNMYTTETVIAEFLLLKDTLGRRIYKTLDEIANELRVKEIIPVEVMEEEPLLLAVIVNPNDYVYGATRGGEVNMFDDFDIDYNQYKYLIETRCCGALVKLKSAIVVRAVDTGTDTAVVPNAPTFDEETGVLTIVATTGITYKNADTDATLATGAQAAIEVGETINVRAVPGSTYYIESSEDAYWTFTREV